MNDYNLIKKLLTTGAWRIVKQDELYQTGDVLCWRGQTIPVTFREGDRCNTEYGPVLRKIPGATELPVEERRLFSGEVRWAVKGSPLEPVDFDPSTLPPLDAASRALIMIKAIIDEWSRHRDPFKNEPEVAEAIEAVGKFIKETRRQQKERTK